MGKTLPQILAKLDKPPAAHNWALCNHQEQRARPARWSTSRWAFLRSATSMLMPPQGAGLIIVRASAH